jgi:hypothetical protein
MESIESWVTLDGLTLQPPTFYMLLFTLGYHQIDPTEEMGQGGWNQA